MLCCGTCGMKAVPRLQKAYGFWNSRLIDGEKSANQFLGKPSLPIKEAAEFKAMDTLQNNLHIAPAHSTCHSGQ